MKKQTAIFCLLAVTIIWGSGFVATKMAIDFGVSVGIINCIRGLIFTLLVFAIFPKPILNMSREQLKIGLIVGVFNALGFLIQTVGAKYTSPSNSAFITTTNVVMVPFLAWLVYKQRPKLKNFIAIGMCLVGMAVLTGVATSGMKLNVGDLYTLVCAFTYAVSIVLLAKPPENGHFAASAFLIGLTHFLGGLAYFIVVEKAVIPAIDWKVAILSVIYLGIGSSFIAQTMQVMAQKHITASTASLIMVLEGVWGSVFSIMFRYESFTTNLIIGGTLIVVSLVLSEIPSIKTRKKLRIK